VALEAAGSDRTQADGKQGYYGAADCQGDTGGGLPHPARRGGGDDTEEAFLFRGVKNETAFPYIGGVKIESAKTR